MPQENTAAAPITSSLASLFPREKAAPEGGLHAYEPVRHQNFSTWFLTMVCLLVTV